MDSIHARSRDSQYFGVVVGRGNLCPNGPSTKLYQMSKEKKLIIIMGPAMFFTAVWAGSYVVNSLPKEHWAIFPSILTSLILGSAGMVLTMFAAIEMK